MTAEVGNVIENTALHRRKEFLSTPLFLLPIQFMGRKMRSVEVKQHVIYYKTTRRLQQNDTSFSIKQAVVFSKTSRQLRALGQDRYLLLNA